MMTFQVLQLLIAFGMLIAFITLGKRKGCKKRATKKDVCKSTPFILLNFLIVFLI